MLIPSAPLHCIWLSVFPKSAGFKLWFIAFCPCPQVVILDFWSNCRTAIPNLQPKTWNNSQYTHYNQSTFFRTISRVGRKLVVYLNIFCLKLNYHSNIDFFQNRFQNLGIQVAFEWILLARGSIPRCSMSYLFLTNLVFSWSNSYNFCGLNFLSKRTKRFLFPCDTQLYYIFTNICALSIFNYLKFS